MGRQEESGGFLILASSPSGPPDLHQRTSMLPRCCHQSRDSLACEEHAGEGRRPEGRGHAGGHTEGRSGSGQFHSSTPHSAPTAPQVCSAHGSPAARAAGVSPGPLHPPLPTHCLPEKCHQTALGNIPPFFMYMLGSSAISAGSADAIPGIHPAQCSPSHSQLRRRKEVAYSQPEEEFINFPQITRCV